MLAEKAQIIKSNGDQATSLIKWGGERLCKTGDNSLVEWKFKGHRPRRTKYRCLIPEEVTPCIIEAAEIAVWVWRKLWKSKSVFANPTLIA